MKKTLLILAVCIQLPIWGQNLLAEKKEQPLRIQTNTQQLLPGEYLYYSLKLQLTPKENPLEQQPQVAYIALADAKGRVQAVQQILLEQINNQYVGQGELFVPTSLPTGGYNLLGYTANMLDTASEQLSQTPIALLNPYSTARSLEVREIEADTSLQKKNQAHKNIQSLSRPQSLVGTDQWVPFTLPEDLPKHGLYELSVKKTTPFHSQAFFKEKNTQHKEASSVNNNQHNKLPTKTQAGISGSLISSGQPIDRVAVALSFLGADMPFKMTTTDPQGKFNFPLTATVNSSQAVLQVWNAKQSDFQIILDSFPRPDPSRIEKATLNLHLSDLERLKNRSIQNQIENAFNPFKQDSIPLENRPISRLDAYEMNDYILDEYSRFSNFEETVFELMSELSYKKTSANTEVLFVKNVARNVAVAALPLLLLDGIPVPDQNAFRRYPTAEIKSISVSRQQLVMGDQIWNGLVFVRTKGGIPKTYLSQQFLKIWELELPRLKKKYYQHPKNAPKNLPNYAQQLVWLPNQSPEALQEFKGFKTPHMEGLFELSIKGLDTTGKAYSYIKVYDIQDQTK
ncbi:MAG: hypothetical protein KIH80_000500 [Flavobacteriia bacterium]|nr:hypothetical protein [Flavobacteriia bacterium]